jgi:hypothetical protein
MFGHFLNAYTSRKFVYGLKLLSPKACFNSSVSAAVFPCSNKTLYGHAALSGQPLQNQKVTETQQ